MSALISKGRRVRTRVERRGGFTLIELMLAVTLLSVVMFLTLDSLSRQQKTAITTEQIVEVQQNVRAIASLIERELRMAGFMVPNASGICGVDRTTGSDEIFISETEMIVPDDERAGDLGSRISSPSPMTSFTGTITMTVDSTDLDEDGSFFYDNDSNGTPESDFRVGGGAIVADMANPHRGVACGVVAATSGTTVRVVFSSTTNLVALAGSDAAEELIVVPAAHYRINTTGFTTGRLERNGDLLANGIDDLQFSYFFDMDDDGVQDMTTGSPALAVEEPGTVGVAAYDPSAWDNEMLKEVRFSIVVRTRANDPDFAAGSFLTFENRAAPTPAVNDGFRRRVIVGAVRPRNIGQTGSI